MHSTGSGLWAIHILSVVAFFVGVALLILWAAKTFPPATLKLWGIGLVVLGTVACLLTIGIRGTPWGADGMMRERIGMMRMHMMENGMMMDDDDMDAMSMSMHDMSAMLEGKTGDDFDKAFIAGMIPHHQGAIDMAKAAQQYAKHDEIKAMAAAIISAQQKEIDTMRQWQKSWGYTQ